LVEESEDPAAAATERLDEWEEDRAETETGRELVRSANAFTKAAWALVGVTAISWRAVGKSCPYCDELDGRTVEITRSFLEAGESVADLTVLTRVGHPPVHKGCDCVLMPETGSRAALSSAEIRTVLRDIADGAGAGLDDCGSGCAHDHGEPRGRAWRVERDEQIRERDRQIGKAFDSRAAAFAAIAREFSVSPRTVERAVYRR
jgi:hypothetical protein